MAVKKNISTKRKKKVWYGLYAPDSLNNAFLGETHVYNTDELIGKAIKMHLSMITNDMKKQNIIASFRVKEFKDGKGLTDLTSYSLSLAHLKRLVRRKRDKIDDSFLAKDKEGKTIRIKTVCMTNSKTYDSVSSAVRLSLRTKIKKTLKDMSFSEFVNALINIRLQRDWKTSLNKIYPLKFVEVRHAGLEVPKKNVEEEEDKDLTEVVKEEDIELESEVDLTKESDSEEVSEEKLENVEESKEEVSEEPKKTDEKK